MSPGIPARLSATVLLLRQSGVELQVLMQKRAIGMAFSAHWVFPGGTVAPDDGDPVVDLDGTLRRAAVRETREEAGIGADPDSLIAWSRWITPAVRTRRYDAWFFAAALPAGAEATGDGGEAVETWWVAPDAALAARTDGAMPMMPPTAVVLMDLAASFRAHGSLPALLAGERRREIVPILPRLVELAEGVFTVYPWDPEYGALPGEGIDLERVPAHLRRLPSRMRAPRVQP